MLTTLTKLLARRSSRESTPEIDPERERLKNLVLTIRRDYEYFGVRPIPAAQTRPVAEACRQLLSCVQGQDLIEVFKGINAFPGGEHLADANLHQCAWTKLTEIVESPEGYAEGHTRNMLDIFVRAFQRQVELDGEIHDFIVRKLHEAAAHRGLSTDDD